MNEADPVGLTALVEASAIHSSIRIVSNDVTITPAQSEKNIYIYKKKQLPSQRAGV